MLLFLNQFFNRINLNIKGTLLFWIVLLSSEEIINNKQENNTKKAELKPRFQSPTSAIKHSHHR